MEQLASASRPPRHGSFGALLRTFRHRAYLSQEQLAARAELSERTVRNLEADRVRSPRNDTMRLLADALQLSEPERKSWFEAARSVNRRRAQPAMPGAAGPAQLASDAPTQRPLNACGFDTGNRPLCRCSPSAEFKATIVCVAAGRAGAERARPLERPGKADGALADGSGRLLRRHRHWVGLTQKELGELSGISPRVIGDPERGRTRRPQRSAVKALARALALDDKQAQRLTAALTSSGQDERLLGLLLDEVEVSMLTSGCCRCVFVAGFTLAELPFASFAELTVSVPALTLRPPR